MVSHFGYSLLGGYHLADSCPKRVGPSDSDVEIIEESRFPEFFPDLIGFQPTRSKPSIEVGICGLLSHLKHPQRATRKKASVKRYAY